jgi:subtilisin family serine protease
LAKADARFAHVAHAYKVAATNHDVLLLDQIIARFKPGVTRAQVDSLAATYGSRVRRAPMLDSGYTNYLLSAPTDSAEDVLRVANAIDRHPLAQWATPDMVSDWRIEAAPSDLYYSLQYYLRNSVLWMGVRADINVESAWDSTKGSSTIRITYIDDGVDISHPEFAGRAGSFIGLDQLSFLSTEPGEGAGRPFSRDIHGTGVAGVATAAHDGAGIAGVAPNVQIGSVRIFRNTSDQFGPQVASANAIAQGITWAYQRSDVLNNSWGGGAFNQAIFQAIADALSLGRGGRGSIVVFSAGNQSERRPNWQALIGDPEVYPEIAVLALTRNGPLASYSNKACLGLSDCNGGYNIAIGAFGGEVMPSPCSDNGRPDIVTTQLSFSLVCDDGPNGDDRYTSSFGGTSAAAPQVSGAAALILSRSPTLTAKQLRTRLMRTADYWGNVDTYGNGKLNVSAALISHVGVTITGPTLGSEIGPCIWNATISQGKPPYTYQWSGGGVNIWGSSTGSQMTGTIRGGDLVVTVRDSRGAQGQAYLPVQYYPFTEYNCT